MNFVCGFVLILIANGKFVIKGKLLMRDTLYVLSKFKLVSIMVWACFSGEKFGPTLVSEQGGIESAEY
jgi:hypothetical protein